MRERSLTCSTRSAKVMSPGTISAEFQRSRASTSTLSRYVVRTQLPHNWQLDAMMQVATQSGGQRHVSFDMWCALMSQPLAWDEPDHYHFQQELGKKQDDEEEGATTLSRRCCIQ
mmetsp:Transcript_12014/g.28278  ORF Transcript_12014/g.28278 Transcript_12014/m.28278 type:complete len:115 (-) Transcript_12014:192-536(-)